MAINNINAYMIDRPTWEQLSFAPAAGIAGTCNCDDNRRFMYTYFQTSTTAAQFWRYDTWADCWQQLATPATQTGSVAFVRYIDSVGDTWSGNTYGSVLLLVGNGTIAYFYKYNIATNVWSALTASGLPATFGTDMAFTYPEPQLNAFDPAYHSGVTKTITTSGAVAAGATTIAVTALPIALASGTRLRFGSFNVTIGANAIQGATSLTVSALPQALSAGTLIETNEGDYITVKTAAAAGATTVAVYPIRKPLNNGEIFAIDQYVTLTASAALNAVSLTVSATLYSIATATNAYYYDNIYLIGNNATVMYRYSVGANTWATTSANAANPAIPAVNGSIGAGCTIKWLPSFSPDKLFIVRGGATANVYTYDLVTNTFATLTFYPNTETFSTGSAHSVRGVGGKGFTVLMMKDVTGRIYEGDAGLSRILPKMNQWLWASGTAYQGDRSSCMRSPDGIEFYYYQVATGSAMLRCALLDS